MTKSTPLGWHVPYLRKLVGSYCSSGRILLTLLLLSSLFTSTQVFAQQGGQDCRLEQAQNGGTADKNIINPVIWERGNVNGGKAHLATGLSIPYRLIMTSLTCDNSYQATMIFDAKKNDKYAIDYLTGFQNYTPHPTPQPPHNSGNLGVVEQVDPIADLGLSAGYELDKYTLPAPNFATGAGADYYNTTATGSYADLTASAPDVVTVMNSDPLGNKTQMYGYNADITNIQYLPAVTSASSVTITVIVTFTAKNCGAHAGEPVVLAWGGHIAQDDDWGEGFDATSIPGSPYHMAVEFVKTYPGGNLVCGGNMDAQLATDAIVECVPATVEAGGPNTVCESATPSAITLSGSSFGGGATMATWSITSGSGTLSNTLPTANPELVTFTPDANWSGTVTLTLTTNIPIGAGDCVAVSDTRTVTVTDNPDITVQNLTACEDGTSGSASVNLNNAILTNPDAGTITFYNSLSDAQNETGAVTSPATVTVASSPRTFYIRAEAGTTNCYSTSSFTVTVTDNPDVTANSTTICSGDVIDLNTLITAADGGTITFHASQADANAGINAISQPVSPAIGAHTYYVRSTNGTCYGTTTLTVTVNACGANCTYTQGYYGNKNGNSCDGDGTNGTPITYQSPTDLIKALLGVGGTPNPLVVGAGGTTVTIPATATAATLLNSSMPGGGTARELFGSCTVESPAAACWTASTNPNTSYLTKQGRINNVLLSQTITLGLNLRISSSLPGFELEAGVLVTADPDGPCGTTTPKARSCVYSTVWPYALISDGYTYKTITADVVNALNAHYTNTVQGLFDFANDALGNVDGTMDTEHGVSLSAINAAVDAINNAFDGCKVFIGWDDETTCAPTNPAIISSSRMATGGEDQSLVKMNVKAFPNPFNDRIQFSIESNVSGKGSLVVYNMIGQKVKTVFEGYVFAGRGQVVDFKVPAASRANLIYILTINGKQRTGKVINQRR